ncbi:unnamed protein product [Arabidopsis halleri]
MYNFERLLMFLLDCRALSSFWVILVSYNSLSLEEVKS